jgi:hypothetical protein
MKEIEILLNEAGVPEVTPHGDANAAAAAKGDFLRSIYL